MLSDGRLKTPHAITRRAYVLIAGAGIVFLLLSATVVADGWFTGTPSTRAPNQQYQVPEHMEPSDTLDKNIGGIITTRHNLTQAYTQASWGRPTGAFGNLMNPYRNDYFEVCVYCHTPHGANSTVAAPLWNRTIKQNSYILYNNRSSMVDLDKTQPGPNSLTCLSCHDGVTAIDSIINMPTRLNGTARAGYSQAQETEDNKSFLDAWSGSGENAGNTLGMSGPADPNVTSGARQHFAMAGSDGGGVGCLTCHSTVGNTPGVLAPSFQMFVIAGRYTGDVMLGGSPDYSRMGNLDFIESRKASPLTGSYLGDDHPIGVKYPETFGPGSDYREPSIKKAKIAFFDRNGNQHADPNEVRLYNTGDGYEVECGSCHDPHGVPSLAKAGDTTNLDRKLNPSFLRMGRVTDFQVTGSSGVSGNYGSELCLTCHVK